ncbi:hypothetical protein MMPV_000722 [Pyropia vietnamensis]
MAPCRSTASAALLLVTAAVAAAAGASSAATQECPTGPLLVCTLSPTAGNQVGGNVTMTPTTTADGNCTTALAATVTGLKEGSIHGWHIHEFGNLSSPTGTGTGGHYNPKGVPHALPSSGRVRHTGDLGNLEPAGPDGIAIAPLGATSDLVVTSEVVGRGVIIHAKRDDGGQPTGNAGARLAQCVLGVGRPLATPRPAVPSGSPSPTPARTPAPTPTPTPTSTPSSTEEPVDRDEEVRDSLPVVILGPEEISSTFVVVTPTPVALSMTVSTYKAGN